MSRAQISDHQPNFLKICLSTRFQCVHFPGVLSRNAVGISSLLGLTHRAWESGTEVSIDIPGRGWIVNLSLCRYMSCLALHSSGSRILQLVAKNPAPEFSEFLNP